MRYQNLRADFIDRDFLDFTNGSSEGNIDVQMIDLSQNYRMISKIFVKEFCTISALWRTIIT